MLSMNRSMKSMRRTLTVLLGLCGLLILAVGLATAQEKGSPGSASPSIPIPEIATRAEEVTVLLRNLETLLAPNPDVEAIRLRLPELTTQIDTRLDETMQRLDGQPSVDVVDELLAFWQRTRGELAKALERLTQRAIRLEDELERLSGVLETWKRARADARTSMAPAPVLQRVDLLLASIPDVQKRLREERGAVLVLQDLVAKQLARCEEALDRVASFRQDYVGQILKRDASPVWSREAQEKAWADVVATSRESYEAGATHLREFFREGSGGFLLLLALFVGLILLLRTARRRTHVWHLMDDRGFSVELMFAHPVATALVVALLTFFWFHPHPPRVVTVVVSLTTLAAVIRSVAPLVEPWQVRWLCALGAFFLVDLLRSMFAVVPQFERQLFLLEMLVGAAAIGWGLYRNRAVLMRQEQVRKGPPDKVVVASMLLLTGFGVAFLTGATGFMSLGRQVGYGTLGSAYAALALSAGIRVAYGLMVLVLRIWPLTRLRSVDRHRSLMEERGLRLLQWCAAVAWVRATLGFFSLAVPITTALRGALAAEFGWGALRVALGDVLAFALTVWLAFLVSRFIRFLLEEDVFDRVQMAPGVPYAISTMLHYVILFLGFLLAMAALGLDLNKVTIIGGAFGVGIGFGLQNVVNNFVSGLIVLFERPIRVGDAVQIGDVTGEVRRIGIRSSTVRTWEGAEVVVPNAILVSERVTNWTLTDRRRRIDVRVGVTYGSVPERVLDLLETVARSHPRVASDPAPLPLFTGFGDSALLFELRVWTNQLDEYLQTRSELSVALHAALREAGIEIAFPVRELLLRHESGHTAASDRAES
jgi:potassium-dependent mechanosensitive channel